MGICSERRALSGTVRGTANKIQVRFVNGSMDPLACIWSTMRGRNTFQLWNLARN